MRGFRLFFVLGAALAALWVPLWVLRYAGVLSPPSYPPGAAWHGHEMVYGFVAAVMAGFLTVGTGGWRIHVLAAAWLAGRAAMMPPETLPPVAAAAIDLAFLPLLAALRRPPLWAAPKLLTAGLLVILAAFWGIDLWLHVAALGGGDADRPAAAAAALVALLLALVGGRLVPGHTRAALRRGTGLTLTRSEAATIAAGIALVAASAVEASIGVGVAALALAALQAYRLARWWDAAILRDPLLWVLHLGFAWLALGLALLAGAMLAGWPDADTARHGWLAGGAGSLTLGIMVRLALSHTGRPLRAGPLSVAAFVLVSLAAAARLAGPMLRQDLAGHGLAATAWALAFVLFLADHADPLLRRRRGDGR